MKRSFDVIVSFLFLFISLPFFIIVACFVKLDGGSVFYRQLRVGKNDEKFYIYKFRSMVVNADKIGGYSTTASDKRVTKIGKLLRKTSIDELPQLVNVLKGEMSLVGPRPNVPQQRAEYTKEQWDKRNSVHPGITGLAQATFRSLATWEERYGCDEYYIDNYTFSLDLKIILLTIKQIFCKGSY